MCSQTLNWSLGDPFTANDEPPFLGSNGCFFLKVTNHWLHSGRVYTYWCWWMGSIAKTWWVQQKQVENECYVVWIFSPLSPKMRDMTMYIQLYMHAHSMYCITCISLVYLVSMIDCCCELLPVRWNHKVLPAQAPQESLELRWTHWNRIPRPLNKH